VLAVLKTQCNLRNKGAFLIVRTFKGLRTVHLLHGVKTL
jgi:hypothetical protein